MSSVFDPLEELPNPESPYEGRKISALEHLVLAAYWFGSNFIWGAFLGPVLSSHMTKLAPLNSAEVLGLMYTLGALPALIIPLIAGPLSDRCRSKLGRRRPYILVGGAISLGGIALMALGFNALSIASYFGGYLLLQIGANTALGAYSGIIPDLVPPEQRGLASGYMALMSQLSTLFGALSSGLMIDKGMSNQMFMTLAVVYTIFVGISVIGIKERPFTGKVEPFHPITYLKSLWIDPRKHPDFAWVWITRALMMFGFYSIQPYLLYFLRDVIQVKNPASTAGIALGVILLAATISGFLGGHISDRTGRKPVVIYSSIIIAGMSLVFLLCRNLEQALTAGLIFGIGYGAYISVDWALGADVLPNKDDAGKDMAVWHVSMTLPQQLAPLLAGLILGSFKVAEVTEGTEKVARYGLTGYAVVFAIASICFFAGGVLVKHVKGVR